MKRIIINRMKLTNFKGVQSLEVSFNERTVIRGRNGSGKTTVYDAFTWLLFGKDSEDRKVFSIKTLDMNGEPIMHLPHEVSADFTVITDGQEETLTLTRAYTEKWVKRRGETEPEFAGHTEERFWNDVPCSKREFDDKIKDLCDEQVFKLITNPTHFERQDIRFKRELLIRMAGGISDEDIAAGDNSFTALLDQLSGKTLVEYAREVNAKKARIKAEVDSIPNRIDERQRDMPADEDWGKLHEQYGDLDQQRKDVEGMIADAAKSYDAARQEQIKRVNEYNSIRLERKRLEGELQVAGTAAWREKKIEQNRLINEVNVIKDEMAFTYKAIDKLKNDIAKLEERRNGLIAEYRAIKARRLQFQDGAFICPTCHRELEFEDIEEKKAHMVAEFNLKNASDLEDNKKKGLAVRAEIDTANDRILKFEEKNADYQQKLNEITSQPIFNEDLSVEPTVNFSDNERYLDLKRREEEASTLCNEQPSVTTSSELQNRLYSIQRQMEDLKVRLSRREIIERNNCRIEELRSELQAQNAELARLEGIEFTIREFGKARMAYVESKINSMFKIVKFRLFARQINGGEVETCETTINGVPYDGGLSNAQRILAGLDVINAICRFEGISAPCFLDNAESINDIPEMESQTVCLVVSEDESLVVE